MADITQILSINSGSSSIKFALFAFGTGLERQQLEGAVERIGQSVGRIWLEQAGQRVLDRQQAFPDQSAALQAIVQALTERGITHPDAIGHRIVSGGPHRQAHVRIDEAVLHDLRNALAFAPLHLPAEIAAIESLQKIWPEKTQVACLDTAFHQSMPEVAARLPLPRNLWEEGVRKYGFHGLSYEYIVSQLPDQGKAPTIIAHLGNGASMAAVVDGHCLDTTMGLTPTGGLVMGTRSGDLDPGVLLYLMVEKGYTAPQLERLLNHLSGLLGISACSGDMQTLLQQREQNPHAAEAIAQFAYSARKHIGSLMAVLGSVQRLIFTGGIGEHAAAVRWAICRPLEALGFHLDPVANSAVAQAARRISARESPIEVLVMPTDEDLMIARHTLRLLGTGTP
ncbi:acetate/propionate family kinase [Acidithiobacillus sulfurivorans]|uniref:Acetate kinase n=1 Tax=Acidithiobacillus sulfurivorans TaxID=1958756 RepID=A0ABS6A1C4_9PROT|nr:acetate/propionate family kinase [Acidithiobacillus sulfurivorans]MBU2761200.1 acetate/propionate family kinase [Acidithiobacillus sulfurivorans]